MFKEMFKLIRNGMRLRRMNKLLRELCSNRSCCGCPANIEVVSGNGYGCAQCYIIDQSIEKWGLDKEIV